MVKRIKTAGEWINDLTAEERRQKRIEKARANAPAISIEDLRDETMSIVRNSGLSYDEIHARFGASGSTLSKWQYREVLRPQLNTIRGTLQACGYDLVIAAKRPASQSSGPNVVRLKPTNGK